MSKPIEVVTENTDIVITYICPVCGAVMRSDYLTTEKSKRRKKLKYKTKSKYSIYVRLLVCDQCDYVWNIDYDKEFKL